MLKKTRSGKKKKRKKDFQDVQNQRSFQNSWRFGVYGTFCVSHCIVVDGFNILEAGKLMQKKSIGPAVY